MSSRSILIVGAVLLVGGTAHAAVITSLDRAQFAAAASMGTVGSQNFDGLASGTVLSTLDGVTYGASAGSPIVTSSFLTSTGVNGLGSTSVGFFRGSEIATFSFAAPITAFAIDVNTYATTSGAYVATLNTGDTVNSLPLTFPNQSTGEFIGFVTDQSFNSVSIRSASLPYTLDTLVYGAASAVMPVSPLDPTPTPTSVPEPSSLLLLGAVLLGLGGSCAAGPRRSERLIGT